MSIYNDSTGNVEQHLFEPLLTIDEAKTKIEQIVHSFFENGKSTFINVSTGFGKTKIALEILKQLPWQKRVLYLVPGHTLGEEIVEKYHKYAVDQPDDSLPQFERMLRKKGMHRIVHLKGKKLACENTKILEQFEAAGVTIPLQYCKDKCSKYAISGCKYIEQFNDYYTIRVMTHDEFRNDHQSAWFYGNTGTDGSIPKNGTRKPDYIIVDEDWLKSDHKSASMNSEFHSICSIIYSLNNDTNLPDAIHNFKEVVLSDYKRAKDITNPLFESPNQYITDYKKYVGQLADFEILEEFYKFIQTGDDSQISQMKLHNKHLHYFNMKKIASRYQDVPILFLDATANEEIVKKTIGEIDFHSIKVKSDEQVNVHQAEFNVSRNWLKKNDNLNHLIEYIRKLKTQYKKVGVITYKRIEFDNGAIIPFFDEYLKDETGIDVCNHFGNIRGIDEFEDVDCLIVAGMHFIPLHEILNYAHAIFGEQISEEFTWEDTPIRMKDGSVEYVSNRRYVDERLEWVKQHWCIAENKQAVGRIRMIHTDKPKDIYFLSKESLGGDIEITDFIRTETIIKSNKYDEAIAKLEEIGYCRDKPAELLLLGLEKSWIKNNRAGIDYAFLSAGIEKVTISSRSKNSKPLVHDYYVSDNAKFDVYLKEIRGVVGNP